MSLKITKIINRIKNINPAVPILSIVSSSNGFPRSFSIIKNNTCPPSSAGMGRKFTIARSSEIIAINKSPEKIPLLSIMSPPTFVIAIIP